MSIQFVCWLIRGSKRRNFSTYRHQWNNRRPNSSVDIVNKSNGRRGCGCRQPRPQREPGESSVAETYLNPSSDHTWVDLGNWNRSCMLCVCFSFAVPLVNLFEKKTVIGQSVLEKSNFSALRFWQNQRWVTGDGNQICVYTPLPTVLDVNIYL